MLIKKITVGFVIQTFDTDKPATGKAPWDDKDAPPAMGACIEQEFVAGEQVDFETPTGEPVTNSELTDPLYFTFNMEQPVDN